MRVLNHDSAVDLLRSQGVGGGAEIEKILGGFDFDQPVYEQDFWPGDFLYQLIRLPSSTLPLPIAGNWFGLAGLTTKGVAINDGLSGRRAAKYEVRAWFKALEGTAKELPVDLGRAIGGPGGATEVFVPSFLLGHLQSIGPVDRW